MCNLSSLQCQLIERVAGTVKNQETKQTVIECLATALKCKEKDIMQVLEKKSCEALKKKGG